VGAENGLEAQPMSRPTPSAAAWSWAEKMAAHHDKIRKVLAFLSSEIWTTPGVLRFLLGAADRPADKSNFRRFLSKLTAENLVVVDEIGDVEVIGITAEGQSWISWHLGKPLVETLYQVGRAGVSQIDHRVDLQILRIRLARAGWTGWRYPDRVSPAQKVKKGHYRPDALVTNPDGIRVALEIERTAKTSKRYRYVVGQHLSQIAAGQYLCVLYCCPDSRRLLAVQSAIQNLGRVVVGGVDKPVTKTDLDRFHFLTYEQVPTWTERSI
jgi:hypothetical protein